MENPLKRRRTDDERPKDRDKPKLDRENGGQPPKEAKPPKKGSFAELMNRAKTQAKPITVGMYQHKVTKALTKREIRLEREKQAALARKPTKTKPDAELKARPVAKTGFVKAAAFKPKPKMEYTGTSYKGPFKVEQPPPREERRQYESESEDYESDASSDMEATGFEVEAEERRSALQAKREDEEAERQELEHQRQKALRKKKMAELAKRRRV